MNYIDLAVIAVLAYALLKGFSNGLIKELAGLLGVIVGIWTGLRLAFIFADYYRENLDIPAKTIPFLAFLTAFILGLVAVHFAGRLLNKAIDTASLTGVNKALGALFGGLKFAYIIGALFLLLNHAEIIPRDTRDSSASFSILKSYSKTVNDYSIGLVPLAENLFDELEAYFMAIETSRLQPTDSLNGTGH